MREFVCLLHTLARTPVKCLTSEQTGKSTHKKAFFSFKTCVSAHTGADSRDLASEQTEKIRGRNTQKKKGNTKKKVTKKETITKKKPARPRFLDMLTETPKSVPYTFSKVREYILKSQREPCYICYVCKVLHRRTI